MSERDRKRSKKYQDKKDNQNSSNQSSSSQSSKQSSISKSSSSSSGKNSNRNNNSSSQSPSTSSNKQKHHKQHKSRKDQKSRSRDKNSDRSGHKIKRNIFKNELISKKYVEDELYNNKNKSSDQQRTQKQNDKDQGEEEKISTLPKQQQQLQSQTANIQEGGGQLNQGKQVQEVVQKEMPNFQPSGILAKFTNTVNGVTLKFTEPLDAKVPNEKWRIYPFKGSEAMHKSCLLFGKDIRICDIILENPTVSGQHSVIQFREKKIIDQLQGIVNSEIKPYLMDLESTNGTMLNGQKIEPARYYELLHEDVIRFGCSQRDYVIMKEKQDSK